MDTKSRVREKLQQLEPSLLQLSHRIHATPEIGWQEEKSSRMIADVLSDAGFSVNSGICELPTAFSATSGSGALHFSICVEYDSLPGIGHACGHNIIAAISVGAAIALAAVADDIGITVRALGTPAEEVGNASGKILLLERGGFAGTHASMMVHPAPFDAVTPSIIAASMFEVKYRGKEAHASAFPELGINAADALTVAQVSLGLLRQHILPTQRIHGFTTHGGDAPNVIPAHTAARYIVRGKDIEELEALRPKVYRCFEAGAIATGAKLEIVGGDKPYAQMLHDPDLANLYRENAIAVGRKFPDLGPMAQRAAGSTDMGNVSLAIPSIHPMIGIDSFPAVNHQPEFTAHCIQPAADRAVIEGALALAWTAVDAATKPEIRSRLMKI